MIAQRRGRLIGAALSLRAQQLEVLVGEARALPAAVRAWAEVAGLAVLAQHLLDEGLPDAEGGGDLFDGRVAALDRRDHSLPQFSVPGRRFAEWPAVSPKEGAIYMCGPHYAPDVVEFFRLAAQGCWRDRQYTSKESSRMVEDAEFVRRASLEQVKTMLTRCVRSERFCDGAWASLLSGGHIQNLLRRLQLLREEV